MKQELPPGVIAAVLVVVIVLVGLFFFWRAQPGGSKEEVDKAIANSAVKIAPGAVPGPAGAPAASGPARK